MDTALEYSTGVVQEGGRRCIAYHPIPLMNPPPLFRKSQLRVLRSSLTNGTTRKESNDQGGRTRHDFSLAWLEAVWHCSGSGHRPTGNEPVQKMLCKLCTTLMYFPSTEFKSAFNVHILTRWRSCRVILYRTLHLGVSFFEGGLLAGVE